MKLNSLIPLVDVNNVEESIQFYEDALGFSIEDKLVWNGAIEWALLRSGPVRIMLSSGGEPHEDTYVVPKNGVFFIYPDDIQHLYDSLQHKGFETSALQAGQRGAREFYLQDPDGYVLWFSHKQVYETVPA